MDMRTFARRAAALAPLAVLAACHDGSGSGAAFPAPTVVDLEVGAERIFGHGDLRLVYVSEAQQAQDLDGDGDTADLIAHVLDLETGVLTSSGLPVHPRFSRQAGNDPQHDEVAPPEVACGDELCVFPVSEPEAGQDINGDADATDVLAYAFDAVSGEFTDLGLAYQGAVIEGRLAVLSAFDLGSGTSGAFLFDGADGSLTELPFENALVYGMAGEKIALGVAEDALDLNGDGDLTDPEVLFLYDVRTGDLQNTAQAVLGPFVVPAQGFWGMRRLESGQQEDLNGDGDQEDVVLGVFDPTTGLTQNTRLAGVEFQLALDGFDPRRFRVLVDEAGAGADLNDDGDELDSVLHLYDPLIDLLQNTGLATHRSLGSAATDRWVAVSVLEDAQGGEDLDGNGSSDDIVLQTFDTRTGLVVNTGAEAFGLVAIDQHFLVLRVEQGEDFNGDGDQDDFVQFDWSARSRSLRNTRTAIGGLLGSVGERALALVLEDAQGEDLNDDGDTQDFVLARYDARSLRIASLGLASTDAWMAPSGRMAALVPEQMQGADLNGDGDLVDKVLHLVTP